MKNWRFRCPKREQKLRLRPVRLDMFPCGMNKHQREKCLSSFLLFICFILLRRVSLWRKESFSFVIYIGFWAKTRDEKKRFSWKIFLPVSDPNSSPNCFSIVLLFAFTWKKLWRWWWSFLPRNERCLSSSHLKTSENSLMKVNLKSIYVARR